MNTDHPYDLIEEAGEILETTLTEEDRDHLQSIYKDVNREIRWGQVLDNALPVLLELAEELIETEGMCKGNSPWDKVCGDDQDLFDNPEDLKVMARRHIMLLSLAKKLLGGLKTRVNQCVADIRIISPDEEIQLLEIATQPEPIEDEVEEVRQKKNTEVVAAIEISPQGTCKNGSTHGRTTIRWKRRNEDMFKETYCKDCRTVIEKIQVVTDRQVKKPCSHPGAEWVEGQEGKEAICTEPSCKAPIPNPETYHWVDAGLEPFDDDPTTDEVITLCSDY